MLVMNGSAGEGLILHEVAHQYVHGILANNEWREAWLDEGLASFLTAWFREEQAGPGVWLSTMAGLSRLERLGIAEPVSTPAKDFSSFQMYGSMSYAKAASCWARMTSAACCASTMPATDSVT
jgi:aminopeptidase N